MSSDNDFKRKINVIDKQYLGKKKKKVRRLKMIQLNKENKEVRKVGTIWGCRRLWFPEKFWL